MAAFSNSIRNAIVQELPEAEIIDFPPYQPHPIRDAVSILIESTATTSTKRSEAGRDG